MNRPLIVAALLLSSALAPAAEYTPALRTPDLTCRVRDPKGQLVRSMSRRRLFLTLIGALDTKHPKNVPPGFVVNHIVPLACGGCDVPSNMELMTVAAWKGRTGAERADCGRHQGGVWTWSR